MSTEGFDPTKVRVFGGRFTFNERSECPPGMSPNCNDVDFGVNNVRSRAGLGLRMTDASGVNGLKSFYPQDRVRRLAILENNGDFCLESPEGTLAARLTTGIAPGAIMKSKFAFNRLWMCFSDGKRPLDYPWALEPSPVGNYTSGELLSATAPNLFGEAITISQLGTGTTADGLRYFFVTEEDRYGFVTGQSRVFSMTGAGALKFVIANIATAPDETSAARGAAAKRRVWCTVAGGLGSFYSIGSFVFDNAVSTVTLDFTDTTLQSSGRFFDSYMTQVPAPPAIGVHSYNSRLAYWGTYGGAPTQLALLSTVPALAPFSQLMGPANFDFSTFVPKVRAGGGTNDDQSWWFCDASLNGATLATGAGSAAEGTRSRSCLRISSDGSTYAGYVRLQTSGKVVNQDATPTYYLQPGHRYGLLVRIKKGANWTSGTASISLTQSGADNAGVLASASILPTSLSTDWQILDIPPSAFAVEGIWPTSTGDVGMGITFYPLYPNAGADFFVDWVRPYDAAAKFEGSTLWWSLFDQPSAFDLVSSPQAINPGDGEEIRCVFEQTGSTYVVKERSMWVTSDNGQDPSEWPVDNVSFVLGTPSVHGVALGDKFAIIASPYGLYRFDSGEMEKLSLEIQPDWDAIDWVNQGHLVHVTVDTKLQRIRVAVPTSDVLGQCSKVFTMDYVEGWGPGSNSGGAGRKWSTDAAVTSCSEIAQRDALSSRVVYGGQRTSSNDANVTFASGWTQLGSLSPSITGAQADPLGAATASRWAYGVSGTCRASYTSAVAVAASGYFVVSFWVKATASGAGNSGIVRDPFGLVDIPFTVSADWQRVVAVFGPAPVVGSSTETIDIDFGSANASYPDVLLFGPQLQAGQYDKGWTPFGAASHESGFISQPMTGLAGSPGWAVQDWDGSISPVYEFAPFGLELGRSNFNKIVARIRGLGQLAAHWVQPDNIVTALNAGAFPQMNSNPVHDVEMGGQAQGTFVGVRLSTSGIANWFSLKRFGCFTREHEGAPFRGKT